METQKADTDIQAGILYRMVFLIEEQTGIANRFIVGIHCDRRTDSLDFEQVKGLKTTGNIPGDVL